MRGKARRIGTSRSGYDRDGATYEVAGGTNPFLVPEILSMVVGSDGDK